MRGGRGGYSGACAEPMAAVNGVAKRPAGTGGGMRRGMTEGGPLASGAAGTGSGTLDDGGAGACGSLCPFSTISCSFSIFTLRTWASFRWLG